MGHRGIENSMTAVLVRLPKHQLGIQDAVVGVVYGWTTKESRFDS